MQCILKIICTNVGRCSRTRQNNGLIKGLALTFLQLIDNCSSRRYSTIYHGRKIFGAGAYSSFYKVISKRDNAFLIASMTKPSLHLAVSLFIIPQIQKLVLWHFISTPADPRLPAEFPGHTAFRLTALKVLHIIFSYIDIGSVANILTFPSALTHLRLRHHKGACSSFHLPQFVPDGHVEETRTKDDLCQAMYSTTATFAGDVECDRLGRIPLQMIRTDSPTP